MNTADIDIRTRPMKNSRQWSSPKEAGLNTAMRDEPDRDTGLDIEEEHTDLYLNRVSRHQVRQRVLGTQPLTVFRAHRNLQGVQGTTADPGRAVALTAEEMEVSFRHEQRGENRG